jgi:hypothetical protein
MKSMFILLSVLFLSVGCAHRADAQAEELETLVLDIQKLSALKSILKEMYQGYKILSTGYNAIKDISQGSFSMHKLFLDGLLSVSPTVKQYVRIVDIINAQQSLVSEYRAALTRSKSFQLFNTSDINYLQSVYTNLFNKSTEDLDELLMVITDNQLRASDAERLAAIDRIYKDMVQKLEFLRQFNNNAGLLATQRQKALQDNQTLQNIYGIQP